MIPHVEQHLSGKVSVETGSLGDDEVFRDYVAIKMAVALFEQNYSFSPEYIVLKSYDIADQMVAERMVRRVQRAERARQEGATQQ